MFDQKLQELNDMRFTYDNDHDILYLYFGEPKVSYEDETAPGVFLSLSEDNDTLTGLIIMDFKKKNTNEIQNHIPININFSKLHNIIH
ncbi:DUF2283 domain-containing protein [Bacillus subtilis]|uniref:DUF2283 domain-containing protein n=1 Tax=Bacillus subtilis TaxID=1423 RepID=UPI00138982FE|nr:DUF2283 domain-containing protein [Bacillus subtilis]NDK00575.1 hypothetical protein [Bacillus subtilis subsp. subtilis]